MLERVLAVAMVGVGGVLGVCILWWALNAMLDTAVGMAIIAVGGVLGVSALLGLLREWGERH